MTWPRVGSTRVDRNLADPPDVSGWPEAATASALPWRPTTTGHLPGHARHQSSGGEGGLRRVVRAVVCDYRGQLPEQRDGHGPVADRAGPSGSSVLPTLPALPGGSRTGERSDPALAIRQPVGVVLQQPLDRTCEDDDPARVRVLADGTRIRPACPRPCARRSAASGRKSLMLLVMTPRPCVLATSRRTASLLPTSPTRSATATTSWPASRNSAAIRGESCSPTSALTHAAPSHRRSLQHDPVRTRARWLRSRCRSHGGTPRNRQRPPPPARWEPRGTQQPA